MKIKLIDSTDGSKLIIKDVITCILEFWGEKRDPKIAAERVYRGPGNLVIRVMTQTVSYNFLDYRR